MTDTVAKAEPSMIMGNVVPLKKRIEELEEEIRHLKGYIERVQVLS